MKMTAPACNRCGGVFVCVNCEQLLRKQLATMSEVDQMVNAGESPGVHRIINESLYETKFATGPRGGALINFGRGIILESFVPYVEEKTGETYPFMPLPLTGRDIIHDIGRKKDISRWELDACERGTCRCDSRPSGWRLNRPIVRAMLGVTDAFLNDHGRQLPGVIGGSWALVFSTPAFMKECYFNAEFIIPTRAASRTARADREIARSLAACKHAHAAPTRRRHHRRC